MDLQTALFDQPKLVSGFRDSAFTKNRDLPLHRWVPWIAGFSSQLVDDCLEKYIGRRKNGNTWVLDPFAGVGTTLLQGYLHGFNVVGFEINPYAALASRTKLGASAVSIGEFQRNIAAYERFIQGRCPTMDNASGNHIGSSSGDDTRMALFQITVETTERRVLQVEAANRERALAKYNSDLQQSTEYVHEVESECLDEQVIEIAKIKE